MAWSATHATRASGGYTSNENILSSSTQIYICLKVYPSVDNMESGVTDQPLSVPCEVSFHTEERDILVYDQ